MSLLLLFGKPKALEPPPILTRPLGAICLSASVTGAIALEGSRGALCLGAAVTGAAVVTSTRGALALPTERGALGLGSTSTGAMLIRPGKRSGLNLNP